MDKKQKLVELKEKMEKCRRCRLWRTRTNVVFGEGNPNAEIIFTGQCPGYWEDQKGRPFVGQAGKLLDQLLQSISIKRKDVFITNVVHDRPPGNRDPSPDEIEACEPYLERQLEIIEPKIIVTLGRFAMEKFIPNGKITKIHGQPRLINWQGTKIIVLPTFHPAAALRNAKLLEQIKEDFQKIPQVLEKTIKIEEERAEKKAENGRKESEQLVLTV